MYHNKYKVQLHMKTQLKRFGGGGSKSGLNFVHKTILGPPHRVVVMNLASIAGFAFLKKGDAKSLNICFDVLMLRL